MGRGMGGGAGDTSTRTSRPRGTTYSLQCMMQPLETFRQPLRLTGALNQIKNVTFILATGWQDSPFRPFFEKARQNGWKTRTMECGHDIMLDMPEELTRVLLGVSSPRPSD